MHPLAFHVTARLFDDRVITPTTSNRRRLARSILRFGKESGLLVFAIVDTHLHAALVCSREAAGRFIWRTELSAQALFRYGVPFERARIRRITDQKHLANAFRYVLRQYQRHGLEMDPFFDGTALPDLLGFRAGNAWLPGRVRQLLPRVRREELLEIVGDIDFDGLPTSFSPLREAALAALGISDLHVPTIPAASARAAAVHAAGPSLGGTATARLLGITPRTVHRILGRPREPLAVTAVHRQLILREALVEAGVTDG
jgi:hypothetical protein